MSYSQPNSASIRNEACENEPGGVDQLAQSLGVTRQMTETYTVGGYHYTNLTDAIAEGRRRAKLERELL